MRIATSIEIEAGVDEVWALLGVPATYADWNPLTPRIEGDLVEGADVTLHVRLGGMRMKRVHTVSRVEPEVALCWTIKPSFWMHGERCQTLTATPTGCTYTNVEVVEGLLGPLVALFYEGTIRRALEAVGAGLKVAVEGAGRPGAAADL